MQLRVTVRVVVHVVHDTWPQVSDACTRGWNRGTATAAVAAAAYGVGGRPC